MSATGISFRRYLLLVRSLITPQDSEPDRVSGRTRTTIYVGLWLMAALAFQGVLTPEGLTETDTPPMQQRWEWLPCTPWFTLLGLANALCPQTNRDSFTEGMVPAFLVALIYLLISGLLFTEVRRRKPFVQLCALHLAVLAVAVVSCACWWRLPAGGS